MGMGMGGGGGEWVGCNGRCHCKTRVEKSDALASLALLVLRVTKGFVNKISEC